MSPVNSEHKTGTNEFAEQVLTRISLALLTRGISGREICRQLEKSHNWLNKRLSGEQSLTLDDLSDIAGVIGVGVSELLGCRQSNAIHAEAKDLDEVLDDELVPQADKDRILGILGEMVLWAYQRSGQAPPARGRAAPPKGRAAVPRGRAATAPREKAPRRRTS